MTVFPRVRGLEIAIYPFILCGRVLHESLTDTAPNVDSDSALERSEFIFLK
jgi:hypothetical protein